MQPSACLHLGFHPFPFFYVSLSYSLYKGKGEGKEKLPRARTLLRWPLVTVSLLFIYLFVYLFQTLRIKYLFCSVLLSNNPVSILRKSTAGRYRPVRIADGPITARCRFIKDASRATPSVSVDEK